MGQFVVRELVTHNHAVASLDTIKPRECLCPTYTVDLTKFDSLLDHFKNADAVVHLARIRFPYTENGFNVAEQKWEFADVPRGCRTFESKRRDDKQRPGGGLRVRCQENRLRIEPGGVWLLLSER